MLKEENMSEKIDSFAIKPTNKQINNACQIKMHLNPFKNKTVFLTDKKLINQSY